MEKSSKSREERDKDRKLRRHHHHHHHHRHHRDEWSGGEDRDAAAKGSGGSRRSRDDRYRLHRERSRSEDGVWDSVDRGWREDSREDSVERVSASSRKRKDRGFGLDVGERRVRIEEKRERRHEDRVEESVIDGGADTDTERRKERKVREEEKRERRRFEDRVEYPGMDGGEDADAGRRKVRKLRDEEKRERRRFEDHVEDPVMDGGDGADSRRTERKLKEGEKNDRRRFEDRIEDPGTDGGIEAHAGRRKEKKLREEKRERRRFEDRVDDPRMDFGDDPDAGRMKEWKLKDGRREEEMRDGDESADNRKSKEEQTGNETARVLESSELRNARAKGEEKIAVNGEGRSSKGKIKEHDLRYEDDRLEDVPLSNGGRDRSLNGLSNGDYSPSYGEKSSSGAKAAVLENLNMAPEVVSNASASTSNPHPSKVSFTTTNENEGVNITRSDEVPGKSSTDGSTTSVPGKSCNLSLDALAKAKKALQMQKELAEKMKKIPVLGKVRSSDTNSKVEAKKEACKIPASGSANVSSTTSTQTKSGLEHASINISASTLNLPTVGSMPTLSGHTVEAVKRAQEVAARMGFRQDPQFAPLINMFPGPSPDVSMVQKPSKAPVLRLDAQGREIDDHGNVINVPKMTNLSTLKVNINKQKKEAFQILRPELDVDVEKNPHFDERMGINKAKVLRPKRMSFQFVEEGKWSRQAEIARFKNQFGEAQAKELRMKQVQLAKVEPDINPNLIEISERIVIKEKQKDIIPDIEWWDLPILPSGSYSDISKDKWSMEKITIYVEHPLPIQPPAEPAPPPPQPLKLTKKETKKLRTQRRLAKERDRQEMIRQGLLEPPKPKVKMNNLMKVLGTEATQDPTKLEMEIRSAAAEREQAHVDRNIARKLTPAERREKKERKLFEDPCILETIVTVYRANHLSHPKTRFQVDVNAQENKLTGCAVISDGICVVVVEGGKKSNKRYKNLMLKRIDWSVAMENEEEEADDPDGAVNKCSLVWQGSVAKPSFNRFLIHQCKSEAAARKVFADAGVPHYWDLAVRYSDELV